MPRMELDTTLYTRAGVPAAGATARFRQRGTATDINVYAADTGGSPVSQPITADAEGRIAGFIDTDGISSVGIDIVYIVEGVTYTEAWSGAPNNFTWATPTLAGTWIQVVGQAAVAYGKTAEGLVVLKGQVSSGTGTIFTLPAGFRPSQAMRFATISNGAIARVDVSTAGVVSLVAGSATSLNLNGIVFPVL